MRAILILAFLATYASAQSLSTNFQKPITVPLAPGMRPNSSNLAIDYGAKTGAQPTQVHLAIAGPTSVYVIWATENYTVAQGAPTPMDVSKTSSLVMYGSSASNLTLNASGITEVYTQVYNTTQAGIGGMNYSSPYMHTVILANLTPGTQYFYQVGDGTTFSGVYNFTTLLPPGQTYPQRLVWIADAGTSQNASTTIDHTVASLYGSNIGKAPVTFYVGDFSYADHWFPNGSQSNPIVTLSGVTSASFQPVWDLFQRMFEPLFSAAPTMFTVGNHEIEQQQDANYTMWKSIQTRWKAPNGTSNSFFYYSIEFGPVHFITISPYADYSVGSAQWNWLAQDLLSINRTLTPWVFVEFHNPWYTTGGDYKGVEQMRLAMEPLLVQAGVDAVFNGHVHAYERIYPVNNFVLDPCGVNHYTIGDGGNDGGLSFLAANNIDPQYEDTNGGCPNVTSARPKYFVSLAPSVTDPFSYWKNSYTFQADGNSTGVGNPKGYCYNSQPQWSAYREPSFGHGTVDVVNATHALWQWNRNQDSVAVAADATWIIRNTTQCMNKMYPNMRSTNGAMMTATS